MLGCGFRCVLMYVLHQQLGGVIMKHFRFVLEEGLLALLLM